MGEEKKQTLIAQMSAILTKLRAGKFSELTPGEQAVASEIAKYSGVNRRRLPVCSVLSDHDTPSGSGMILAPLIFVLILVFFMYRKPIQEFFGSSKKPSYGGVRKIQKKAPVRHS